MDLLLLTPLPLLVLALGLRLLPLRVDRQEPWSTPVDLGLALGLGLAAALLKAYVLAPLLMLEGTDTSDIGDICATVEALGDLDIAGGIKRQPVVALLPTALTPLLGFFDGLCAASLLSAAGLGAALYLWARVLHSRPAGVAAVVFSCAFTPLVVMTRYLTFYPEAVAAYGLCAAGAAAAVRWRTRATLGLAGAGVGLALAADHMGLVFGLVPLLVALIVALRLPDAPVALDRDGRRRWRRRLVRLAVLAAPLLLSWVAARLVTPSSMYTLEDKAIMFTVDNVGRDVLKPDRVQVGELRADEYAHLRMWTYGWLVDPGRDGDPVRHGYNWGRAGPVGMVKALATLAVLSGEKPATTMRRDKVQHATLEQARASQITPWLPVALTCLALTCVALWRRRWELVALLAVLAPFAVILMAVSGRQVFPKYLMAPMMPVPVLMAVAWVTLAHRAAGEGGARLWQRLGVPALHLALLGLLILGVVPSWISPKSDWRMLHATDGGFYKLWGEQQARPSRDDPAACVRLLEADLRAGHPRSGRLYPRQGLLEPRSRQRFDDPPIPGRSKRPPPGRQGTRPGKPSRK